MDKDKEKDKAYIFPRIIAYVIDILFVSLLVTLISSPFSNNNLENLTKDLEGLSTKYLNKEISSTEYINQYKDLQYDISFNSVPSSIIEIAGVVGYFVIFQFYNKGQTFGKKLMKIKVISNNENELTINNYLYRSLLLNSVLMNMISLFLVLFMNKNYFFYLNLPLQVIQEALLLVTIFMILFKKDGRGLHDKIGNTRVVMVD